MIGYTKDELSIIFIDSINEIDYKRKARILAHYENPREIFTDFSRVKYYFDENLPSGLYAEVLEKISGKYLSEIIDDLEKHGIKGVTYLSKDYPKNLKEIPNHPLCLYAKGNVELLSSDKIFSIVGSRRISAFYENATKELAEKLSGSGIVIVTGSAEGGDTAVIDGAIKSGNIISVLASGYDNVYPAMNRNLIDKVSEKGLVISEYPPRIKGNKWFYPWRNRIIAGLGKGLLVTSGGKVSGTKITAGIAIDFNKDIFAFPYSIGDKKGETCNYLIKSGAYLTESANDVLEYFGISEEREESVELNEEQKVVCKAIKNGNDTIDGLCEELEMQVYELTPIIMSLMLTGIVIKDGTNSYLVTKNIEE